MRTKKLLNEEDQLVYFQKPYVISSSTVYFIILFLRHDDAFHLENL